MLRRQRPGIACSVHPLLRLGGAPARPPAARAPAPRPVSSSSPRQQRSVQRLRFAHAVHGCAPRACCVRAARPGQVWPRAAAHADRGGGGHGVGHPRAGVGQRGAGLSIHGELGLRAAVPVLVCEALRNRRTAPRRGTCFFWVLVAILLAFGRLGRGRSPAAEHIRWRGSKAFHVELWRAGGEGGLVSGCISDGGEPCTRAYQLAWIQSVPHRVQQCGGLLCWDVHPFGHHGGACGSTRCLAALRQACRNTCAQVYARLKAAKTFRAASMMMRQVRRRGAFRRGSGRGGVPGTALGHTSRGVEPCFAV